jgi:serine/threonine-protein kinase
MSCPSCGAELGGETVLDDVHAVETVLLGARGASATTTHEQTTPEGEAFTGETPIANSAPIASELPLFAEHTDDEISHVTAQVPRRPSASEPVRAPGFSSDPPTRFLRGVDQHIELPSGSILDDYEIDAKLGAGAMGVVYSAKHVKLGRRVAIKVIAPTMGSDPQALARFEREARALASLHHPNIVDVSAFGALPDGRSYFVMEYLVGETLDERLARGRMPLDEALDIVDQMARALEAAHAQGIVHRDLKPSNTFLVHIPREQRSIVKLLDFGLVKLAVADGVERTASGAVIGTALYLSPEQARGPNVDGRTDVYALGCIAYELVLGRHPFPEARTPTAAIAAHLTEPPPHPRAIWPAIPAALDLLLFSMLAKDPSYRPTLAQVRNVIASVRSPTTAAGRAMRAATVHVRGSARYARLWIAALVAFALFLGIVIGASVLGGGPSRGEAPRASPGERGEAGRSTRRSESAPQPQLASADQEASLQSPVAEAGAPSSSVEPRGSNTASTDVAITGKAAIVIKKPRPADDTKGAVTAPVPANTRPKPAAMGTLAITSKPSAEILIDGARTGLRTPQADLRLGVGRHRVTLINANADINDTYTIEIKPGGTVMLDKDFSDRAADVPKIAPTKTIDPFKRTPSP